MNLTITFLIIIFFQVNSFAGEFSFVPKMVGIFSDQVETISAKVRLQHNNLEYSCLVDTGARTSIFKDSILLDRPKVGETTGGGISNTENSTDLVQVSMTLGDWQLSDATVGRSNRIPFDCLIGNDFFLGRNFQIDNKAFKISDIGETSHLGMDFPLQVYRSSTGGHFGFKVLLSGIKALSIFDTGASATVVSTDFVSSHPEKFKFLQEVNVTDGNSKTIKSGLYELDQIQFGDVEIRNVQVYVIDLTNLKSKIPNVDVVLGQNIIQKYNWQFNIQKSRYSYEALK